MYYIGAGLIDIILLAAVAIFLIMRLRSLLGTRTGYEKPRDLFGLDDDEQSPVIANEDSMVLDHDEYREKNALTVGITQEAQAGLIQLQARDKEFDLNRFADGVDKAFRMILEAFAQGDTETLSMLLAPSVDKAFQQSIQKREKNNYRQEIIVESIREITIQTVEIQHDQAAISVIIDSDQINATYDQDNKPIVGDPNHISRVKDLWVFRRSLAKDDPTWFLSETKTIEI